MFAALAATARRGCSRTRLQRNFGENMAERFDAIVIGCGQAGSPLCARLDAAGLSSALIERDRLGGTCVNRGCIPTKAMIASARVAELARHALAYGVAIDNPVPVDMPSVKARKDGIVRKFTERLASWIDGMDRVTLIHGHARLVSPRAVAVEARTLEAERIFLDVGARPLVPDLPGVRDVPFLDSTTILDLNFAPEHLVVVGGSYVGLEFAQMFGRFGSRVTIVEKAARLVPKEDEDISEELRRILEGEGVAVRTGAECMALKKTRNGVAVTLRCEHGPPIAEGSHVLLAVGRAPNTDDLGLEAAGVATDGRGYIPVDDELRTNVEGIWALGEVNGRGAFTHTAYNDYEIVAANLLDGERRRVSDRILAYALYTDPPLGRAGMSEQDARASGRKVLQGMLPMSRVGRARAMGETHGFMKVLVDGDSREFLGAAFLGIAGDEAVHAVLDAMYGHVPWTTIRRAVHIHPTASEYIPTLLGVLKPLQ
jgi:pyruvate/2-oxoglutarate dehydrogenase complex dihydrolipoamide dehydrogenase (E3) component